MGYDDRREIFERLEAIERQLRSQHHAHDHQGDHGRHHGGWRHGRRRHRHDDGGDFDEKRVIDTIVGLVSEQVGALLDDRARRAAPARGEGGDEKRIIDQIVACVSEHVGEIVRAELDRRFGPAPLTPAAAPGDGESEPT